MNKLTPLTLDTEFGTYTVLLTYTVVLHAEEKLPCCT